MATAFGTERQHENPALASCLGSAGVPLASSLAAAATGVGDAVASASSLRPPPRSIADLRCRHFGDSMHFVDRLTQISLDLRRVAPGIHRQNALMARLTELNQRLCRRMITRVSDFWVEDAVGTGEVVETTVLYDLTYGD